MSHLRWDFVYQRPQHLLSRFANEHRVFFVEEPVYSESAPRMLVTPRSPHLTVVTPRLPHGLEPPAANELLAMLMRGLLEEQRIGEYILWYYTPLALDFTAGLEPAAVVYDCMDELSAFKGASPEIRTRELALFGRADVVFTGGRSLYEAKRHQHPNIHLFPSSVDVAHFRRARLMLREAADQLAIPRPKIGFAGVIDERMDLDLLTRIADARPDWHIVMIGPVVKIDSATLPVRDNIHYLGSRPYEDLPAYIAAWDVALIPFALNESTRFISPTKTPEYLAAGKPVVSTPIRDVVRPYGDLGLVRVGADADAFVAAISDALTDVRDGAHQLWLGRVDAFLAGLSWDSTWRQMSKLIDATCRRRAPAREKAACLTA